MNDKEIKMLTDDIRGLNNYVNRLCMEYHGITGFCNPSFSQLYSIIKENKQFSHSDFIQAAELIANINSTRVRLERKTQDLMTEVFK